MKHMEKQDLLRNANTDLFWLFYHTFKMSSNLYCEFELTLASIPARTRSTLY